MIIQDHLSADVLVMYLLKTVIRMHTGLAANAERRRDLNIYRTGVWRWRERERVNPKMTDHPV